MYWRSLGRFSVVGAQGRATGPSGGSSRLGHEHDSESEVGTPEFEQVLLLGDTMGVIEATGVSGSQDPTDGNDLGTKP